jgi:hypothetical protein
MLTAQGVGARGASGTRGATAGSGTRHVGQLADVIAAVTCTTVGLVVFYDRKTNTDCESPSL